MYMTGRGLGATEAAGPECPQPTSTAERDRLRSAMTFWTHDYHGQRPLGLHWHEGHPDVKAALADIMPRMKDLVDRPKLLRCSAEARKRAQIWTGQMRDLMGRVKTGKDRKSGRTVVSNDFTWKLHRGPTYTIRSTNNPNIQRAMADSIARIYGKGKPSGQAAPAPQVSHAPGTVVINGQAFSSSAAARAALAPAASAPGAPPAADVATAGLPVDLSGEIAGIPTQYLVYGGIALVAWKMLKGR